MRRLFVSLVVLTPAFAQPSFYKDVLPILQTHCQECHRPGEIAPMPFLTYAGTRPWAKSIRAQVAARKMPPWFADPAYGHFANDRSLSPSDIDTLGAWASAGAPAGDPKDAPASRQWPEAWNIGKPDQVFEMPRPFEVPAKGAVEYQYLILPTHFTEDRWIQKVEVRTTNRAAVHHAVVYIREPGSDWLRSQPQGTMFSVPLAKGFTTSDLLMVYTPGNSSDQWPLGMAKRIPAGSDLVLQMHYTASGKAIEDRTRIGLVFAMMPPRQAVLSLQMSNDRFVIPPGDPNYRVQVSGTLPNDALLLSMFPHMHLRGKAFEYLITGPNGHVETLLKVSHYDFQWQLNYKLAQPRLLKAGTHLTCVGYFDNSPNNPVNPDTTAEVRYGEQSWEEMMIGFFDVAVDAGIDKRKFFEHKQSTSPITVSK
ncbi:MAG TPA: thiol-disulfide isomerase [Bryobacteraceae bacterium]|nr:thiol-disulfide isomerase [Bryobacteraceae bacterium]